MNRIPLLLALGVLAAFPAFAQSEEAEAGDTTEVATDQGEPLRDRIPPVSGHAFLKKGRFEFSPSAVISVKDPFFSKYIFGGTLNFHLMEELSVGLRAGYSLNTVAGSAQICPTDGTACRSPTLQELDGRAPGQIGLITGLDIQWAPLYGKIAVMAEQFLHFDLYAVAGPSALQYLGPDASGIGSTPLWAVGGSIGGGGRVFINRWFTIRAEVRDLIYLEQLYPRPATDLRHQIMVELGVSLFFPLDFKEG